MKLDKEIKEKIYLNLLKPIPKPKKEILTPLPKKITENQRL